MDSRERVLTALGHREPDRVPIHDSPWAATIERWHGEGLPKDVSPAEHFGYEFVSVGADTSPRFPSDVIEETEQFILTRTSTGGINRNFKDHATTPELVDRPVKTRQDWERIKPRLEPAEDRIDWDGVRRTYEEARSRGQFVTYTGGYGFDILQGYMRNVMLLMAMAEDPEWVHEMSMTIAHLVLESGRMLLDGGIDFDAFYSYNDMGYRNALLFSPRAYDLTQREADEMVYSFMHSRGKPIILHSCGRVSELIPTLIEVGLDCLQPLEVKAGMDVRELKRRYGGELAFMGGIDVRAMADPDPSVIEEEIAGKFEVAMKGGGYIYHSDHSVPKNVSFEQYSRTMELVRKYGVAEGTYYRWKSKFGGMEVSEAKRLRTLEAENRKLKVMVADLMLDNKILKDVASKKW